MLTALAIFTARESIHTSIQCTGDRCCTQLTHWPRSQGKGEQEIFATIEMAVTGVRRLHGPNALPPTAEVFVKELWAQHEQ